MTSDTQEATFSLLRLIGKHWHTIGSAYNSPTGAIERDQFPQKGIDELLQWRLMREEEPGEVVLHASVRQMIDQGLKRARLQIISADIAESFDQVLALARQYTRARAEQAHDDADSLLTSLRDNVHDLCDALYGQTQNIREQIETQFGMVTQLSHKLELNEKALQRTRALHEALKNIDMDVLYDIGRTDKMLVMLFHRRIGRAIGLCRADIADALSRLTSSMFHLKSLERRAKMVRQYSTFMKNNPDYTHPEYASFSEVAPIFMRAAPLKLMALADVRNDRQELELTDLLKGVRKRKDVIKEAPSGERTKHNPQQQTAKVVEDSALRKAVRAAFSQCIKSRERLSVDALYPSCPPQIARDIWFYAVINEYHNIGEQLRSQVKLTYEKSATAPLSGNYILKDILLCPA